MNTATSVFAADYHEARARFAHALDAFEQQVGREFARERHVIDAANDLSIDIAELRAPRPQRLYVAVSGIHGVEGYAGSAIQQALLDRLLPECDLQHASVLLVHALNPTGMHAFRRVNANNVDLNRNFDPGDGSLFASDSSAYGQIAALLAPDRPSRTGLAAVIGFLAGIAAAVRRHGFTPLRQATLGGQYAFAQGLFFGGTTLQPETQIFQSRFAQACQGHPEVLLTDLHTGYGARGQVSSLFARVDSPQLQSLMAAGVRDARGRDQAYAARGDLVGWCQHAAKRAQPGCVFNGMVIELGTHGLGVAAQLQDLYRVIGENQSRHHGVTSPAVLDTIARGFRELFNPSEAGWRERIVAASIAHIRPLLSAGGFLPR